MLVAGTGTEVGKTWVAARLAEHAQRRGLTVSARKPVQSFDPDGGPTDAEVLAAATGEPPATVCPPHRSYAVAMAPFMAASALHRPPFTLVDLLAELSWPVCDLGILEPAGGVRSPFTADGADTVDLADAVFPDRILLVADAGLGTLNAVRLCVDALGSHPLEVVLNRYDEGDRLHCANRKWLAAHISAPVHVDVSALVPVPGSR